MEWVHAPSFECWIMVGICMGLLYWTFWGIIYAHGGFPRGFWWEFPGPGACRILSWHPFCCLCYWATLWCGKFIYFAPPSHSVMIFLAYSCCAKNLSTILQYVVSRSSHTGYTHLHLFHHQDIHGVHLSWLLYHTIIIHKFISIR